MNTRLQVEHPVTEFITGLDLVELMIRIAAGEKLPFAQKDIALNGWAIEARVYAEDPFRNFLPSIGRLTYYRPPPASENVRIDTGVYEGAEISMFYDPLIAKLVTYGADRSEATMRMREALDEFYIRGVSHNIGFLSALLAHPRFVAGALTTGFIAEEYPDGFHAADVPHEDPHMLAAAAAFLNQRTADRESTITGRLPGPGSTVPREWVAVVGPNRYPLTVTAMPDGYDVAIEGRTYSLRSAWQPGQALFRVLLNGRPACLQVERLGVGFRLAHGGAQADIKVLTPRGAVFDALMPVKVPADLSKYLLSPMPGLLVSIAVQTGQEVRAGEELAVVEAMKMENILRAARDGVVAIIHVKSGDSLAVDQKILEFE